MCGKEKNRGGKLFIRTRWLEDKKAYQEYAYCPKKIIRKVGDRWGRKEWNKRTDIEECKKCEFFECFC